jgi:GAF domain-containing protein
MVDDRLWTLAEGFIDPQALRASVNALHKRIEAQPLSEALPGLLGATRILFDATGAGVMFVDEGSMLRAVAATDEPGHLLETRQEEAGEGPCVDALVLDRIVASVDLGDDRRWPSLRPILPDHGVRALLGVPVHAGSVAVGSLNVYRNAPHGWDASEIEALETYAKLIERLLETALRAEQATQLAQQLQHALNNRVLIERAVGVLMGRQRIDAVAAFNRLRHAARSSQRKASEIAAEILDQATPGRADDDLDSP